MGGCGGGLVDKAADSGPCNPSAIPLGEKKENKWRSGQGWPILKKNIFNYIYLYYESIYMVIFKLEFDLASTHWYCFQKS